jgi:hypothetical protein
MKKTKVFEGSSTGPDDLRPEYDLDYTRSRPNRFARKVNRDRMLVLLDADVSKVFKSPEEVNRVLRALIEAMPPSSRPARSRS